MRFALASLKPKLQRLLTGLFLVAAGGAQALSPAPTSWPTGDAWAGKSLYLTAPTGYTAYQSCGACHGTTGNNGQDPYGKIGLGANKPATTNNAILSGKMTNVWLRAMTAQQLADVAAFLGNTGVTGPVGTPAATVSPGSLSFASTTVGSTSATLSVTLANTGTAPLLVSSLASGNAAFTVTGGTCTAGGTVAAGASCSVILAFRPSAAGAASATFTVNHNATPATSTVSLSGTGTAAPAPVASITPAQLTFSQVVGSTSSTQTVTLSNTGAAALTLGTVGISGAQAAEFVRAGSSTCVAGASLAPGANCSVLVNFTPAASGARVASLSVAHNAAGSPSTVSLAGTGTATAQPAIAVNNNALSFAAQALSTSSATQTVTVSNAGQAPLVLSTVNLAGTNATDFALSGTCTAGASIAVGGNCSLTVRFSPTAMGARSANVALTSNSTPVTISLSGAAVAAPAPAVSLSAATVAFGTGTVGAAPLTRTVTLTNSGTAALSVTSVAVSGVGFTGTHNCGASVAAGASCTLTLSFAPTSAAAATGQASIVSGAAGSPHAVALTGSGVLASAAVLAWSGANAANFGDTSIGSVSTLSVFTLTNQGPGAASLNSIAIGGGQGAEFLLGGTCAVGASLAANANCTISVAFAPSQVGARAGTLDVMTNGSAPGPVALSGNGVMSAQQVLGLSTPAITFPPVAAGQSAAPMPVRVTNTGTSPLTVTALQLTTGSFSAMPATGALPVTLAPAQSLDINVSLVSGAAGSGTLTDTLTVMTNTAGLSRALAVSATVDAGAAQQTPGNTNVGAGGCVPGEHGVLFDPMLAGMCLLALYLVRRRRQGT